MENLTKEQQAIVEQIDKTFINANRYDLVMALACCLNKYKIKKKEVTK